MKYIGRSLPTIIVLIQIGLLIDSHLSVGNKVGIIYWVCMAISAVIERIKNDHPENSLNGRRKRKYMEVLPIFFTLSYPQILFF